ncbi:3-phosphoserine/phosphohydroxythreonine transaminase [Eubacteriales bacterium KG127]
MTTSRVYNFSAGPSMLPIEVIEKMANELPNYQNSGQSVMEMSHRSQEFGIIIKEAEYNLRKLLNVPDNYKILFLQGGATLQFSMVPLNFMSKYHKSDYIITGSWAKKAYTEATKYGDAKIIASSEDENFSYIPQITKKDIRCDADYVYICYNNTIYGTHFPYIPDTGDIPLVADMSSCILSEEIDVSKFAVIFAGAQKNVGPAGMTIAIIREDMLDKAHPMTPEYLNYKIHAEKDSLYNTPPCFAIYAAGEVFKYLLKSGGVKQMEKINKEKAGKLYNFIDNSKLFKCPVRKEDRSLMNVVMVTGNPELDKSFVEKAKLSSLINLKGHRSIGGLRASIYNAMPEEGVDQLISFMKNFEEENN